MRPGGPGLVPQLSAERIVAVFRAIEIRLSPVRSGSSAHRPSWSWSARLELRRRRSRPMVGGRCCRRRPWASSASIVAEPACSLMAVRLLVEASPRCSPIRFEVVAFRAVIWSSTELLIAQGLGDDDGRTHATETRWLSWRGLRRGSTPGCCDGSRRARGNPWTLTASCAVRSCTSGGHRRALSSFRTRARSGSAASISRRSER